MSLPPVRTGHDDCGRWLVRAFTLLVLISGVTAVPALAKAGPLLAVAQASGDASSSEGSGSSEPEDVPEDAESGDAEVAEQDPADSPVAVGDREADSEPPAPTTQVAEAPRRESAALAVSRAGDAALPAPADRAVDRARAEPPATVAAPPPAPARQTDRGRARDLVSQRPVVEQVRAGAPAGPASQDGQLLPGRRSAEVTIAGPGVVSETASRVLYVAGGALLLLLMLFGAAYRGACALRLPHA